MNENNISIIEKSESKKTPAKNFLKSLLRSPLVWVMLIALFFRGYIDPQGFLDPKHSGKPNMENPDVPTYLEDANLKGLLFSGEVNTVRTPAYLMFTGLHRWLFGDEIMPEMIVFSQRLLSLISVFFFYRIAEYFIQYKILAALTALCYTVMVSVLPINNWILTESLAVSFMVFWFYFLTVYVQKPTMFRAFVTGFGVFLLIMLRPAFLGLLLLIFVFWGIRLLFQRKNFRKDMVGLLSSFTALVLIFNYCHLVYLKTGIFSVTVLSASNQYICMIQSGLFLKENDSPVNRCMQTALKEYLEMFPEKVNDPQLLIRSRTWTYPEDPINFISQKVQDKHLLPNMKDKADYTRFMIGVFQWDYMRFVAGKFLIEKKLFPVYFLILMEVILILILWKKSGQLPLLHLIFFLTITGLLFTAVAGAQDDYLRLSLPVLPLVIIIPFQLLDVILKNICSERL
jgi:hypothetical protein